MYNKTNFNQYILKYILNQNELKYIEERTKILNIDASDNLDLFGCFLIEENNEVIDFKVLVPKIKDQKSMLVNIHEYTHAVLVYRHIFNKIKLDCSEDLPIKNEIEYIKKLK